MHTVACKKSLSARGRVPQIQCRKCGCYLQPRFNCPNHDNDHELAEKQVFAFVKEPTATALPRCCALGRWTAVRGRQHAARASVLCNITCSHAAAAQPTLPHDEQPPGPRSSSTTTFNTTHSSDGAGALWCVEACLAQYSAGEEEDLHTNGLPVHEHVSTTDCVCPPLQRCWQQAAAAESAGRGPGRRPGACCSDSTAAGAPPPATPNHQQLCALVQLPVCTARQQQHNQRP
jgi:hypothetical protein